MSLQTIHVHTMEDWEGVAGALIERLRAPVLVALSGPLGAGKTTLVQMLARQLGVTDRPRSPTFSLLRTYTLPNEQGGIRRLVHIDAYRLEKASDVYALDLEGELAEPGTVVAIEWPEQVGDALQKFRIPIIQVEIDPQGTGERTVRIL